MPDPLVAAAEALLKAWAPDEEVPIEQWFEEMEPHVTTLRAALADHRQRDERAEAAVAVMEANDRLNALYATNVIGISQEAHERLLDDIDNTRLAAMAARRRWAEVEGRGT